MSDIVKEFKNSYGLKPLEKEHAKSVINLERMKHKKINYNMEEIDKILSGNQTKKIRFGYDGSNNVGKKAIGETWTDKNGIKWEQKEYGKAKNSVMDSVRKELSSIKPKNCKNTGNCNFNINNNHDRASNGMYGMCLNCLAEHSTELRKKGQWEDYYQEKLRERIHKNFLGEVEMLEEAVQDLSKIGSEQYVMETGEIERWTGSKTIILTGMLEHVNVLKNVADQYNFEFDSQKLIKEILKYNDDTINFNS